MTCFLMCCFLFNVQAAVKAQHQTVSLKLKQASVAEAIRQLKAQTDLDFFFSHKQVDADRKVSVNLQDVPLEEALKELLGEGYAYEFLNQTVVIRPVEKEVINYPQQKLTLKGTVKDVNGESLPGVTVTIKGTTLGVATDIDGHWALEIPEMDDVVLVFSFVGMKTQEVLYNGQAEIDVILEQDTQEIDEVVVTGIFKRNKEGFTGSATQVSGDEIRTMTSGNVLKALEMLDPGFRMNVSNLAGSNPNAIPDFNMRGQASLGDYSSSDVVVLRGDVNTRPNQPLFVLDGVIGVDATTIMDLDPEQVESITLLKDAAATVIYGSEAANGVVVVETKAPEPGKLRFTYNGNYGLEWPDLSVYDLMNAEEKLRIEELAGYYSNKDDVGLQYYYNNLKQEVLRGVNTYWLGEPVRTAFSHRHGLTIEGGDNILRYKLYLGANWAPGVMKETNLNTKTGKIDLNYRQNKLLINNSLTIDYSDGTRESPYGSFQDYATVNPYYRKTDENGNIKQVLDSGEVETDYNSGGQVANYYTPILNPLWNQQFDSKNSSKDFEIREALRIEYLPIEALRLSLDFSLTRNDGAVEIFKPAQHNDFYEEVDPARKGSYSNTETKQSSYRLGLSAAYNKAFKEHLISAYANYSVKEDVMNTSTLTMIGFPNDKLSEVYMGKEYSSTSGSESVARSLAFVMTLNYAYKQKYAVDYSLSVNGSSEFGKNNRFAPFWSAGIGWNIHQEDFLQDNSWLNLARLRLSYGTSGSQNFDPYQAMRTFKYFGVENYNGLSGAYLLGIGNSDLGWQVTCQLNVGMELELWQHRIKLNVDFYNKLTDDMLSDITLPTSSGFNSYKENIGKVLNRGVEVSLNAYLIRNTESNIFWSVGGTLAYNKNTIKEIDESLDYLNDELLDSDGANPSFLYKEGESMNTIYAVRSLGINPANGKEMFLKLDGTRTYEWDAQDKVACGVNEPKAFGNLNTFFYWKGLSANAIFGYRLGGQIYNSTLAGKVENNNPLNNADRRAYYDRWREPGDIAKYKSVSDLTTTNATTRFVMDENTLECQSVSLGYEWESEWLARHLNISYLDLTLYGEDLFRISTVKQERGISYPYSRKFSLALTVRF